MCLMAKSIYKVAGNTELYIIFTTSDIVGISIQQTIPTSLNKAKRINICANVVKIVTLTFDIDLNNVYR